MNNSDPFSVCTNIYTFTAYRITLEFYEKLFLTLDTHITNVTCSDKFLNKNQMNVISNSISYSKNLWSSAYCENCYVNESASDQIFSNYTEEFQNYYELHITCVQNITSHNLNSSLVCIECDSSYQKLNNIYESLKKSTSNKICFDLEDKVSRWVIDEKLINCF